MKEIEKLRQRVDNIKKVADAAKQVSKEIKESRQQSPTPSTTVQPYRSL